MRRAGTHSTSRRSGITRTAALIHRTREHLHALLLTRRWAPYALLLAALTVLCAAAWPFTLAHLQAVAVLKLVSQQPVPWLVGEAVAKPITTEDITLPGNVRARLYLPLSERLATPHAPAMVVFHGVHHLGIDEPRLQAFAAALASCGLRVLTPELPNIKDYRIDSSSIRTIGQATSWYAEKTGQPVGVLGLSFSGGLALLAAADPAYQPSFRFVVALGSQDNMAHVAQYYLTGEEQRPDGTIEHLTPHEYGALVVEYDHLEDFVPAADVDSIRQVLRQHLYEDKAAEDLALAHLTPLQALEARQLMDSNAAPTRALLARANTRHIADMAGLSPSGHLHTLTTPVYLLHGQADNIIPAAETLWMASELPSTTLKAVLVSPVLSHLDLDTAQPNLMDQWRLIHFLALVMHTAESR